LRIKDVFGFALGCLTVGFTCRRDKQDSTAHQPPNLRKPPPHPHAEGGQVQTVLGALTERQTQRQKKTTQPT
jgi:hypothetical protein